MAGGSTSLFQKVDLRGPDAIFSMQDIDPSIKGAIVGARFAELALHTAGSCSKRSSTSCDTCWPTALTRPHTCTTHIVQCIRV